MKLLLVPLHVYGSIHRALSYVYIPWFKYSTNTYKDNKKWTSSLWFINLSLIVMLPVFDKYTSKILFLLDASNIFFVIFALIIGLISHIDYLILYKTSAYDVFLETFDSSSTLYRTIIYVVDLTILVGLTENLFLYHATVVNRAL